ncbi:hypothetical protein F4810DRAFT_677671 [Camillea tinctor]|nr:hypothetical protein F4810DRAFT_677671 [Camillea tinctor]
MARTRSGKNTSTSTSITTGSSITSTTASASSSSSSSSAPTATISSATRRRKAPEAEQKKGNPSPRSDQDPDRKAGHMSWAARNGQWVVYAVASGGCAAFNGVFAKLTTNDLTTHISRGLSGLLGLGDFEGVLEVGVRCIFFGLNLIFNGVMWTLFTKALARGHSTTQVSIMNTSTNFVVTALLGLAVFAESLPPLWWAGAAMLVAGNVVIGRKDDAPSTSPEGGVNGDGDDDDVESGRATPVQGEEERQGQRRRTARGYGTVVPNGRVDGVEKDSDDEEEEEEGVQGRDGDEVDEDVPLLGDLGDVDRR